MTYDLLKRIHSNVRTPLTSALSNLTYFDVKVVSLDFINAPSFCISDFGVVWRKTDCILNYKQEIYDRFSPFVYLDAMFPYPWVDLSTISHDPKWYPVNLLLGWAFAPETTVACREFALPDDKIGMQPLPVSAYHWQDIDLDQNTPLPSPYLEFLRNIYLS